MRTKQRLLIVGGGIAGLALAIALRKQAVEVDIVERSRAWPTQGTGLYLIGLALRALQSLELRDAVVRNGYNIRKQTLFNQQGRQLAETNVEQFWTSCGPCIGIPRVLLHEWLANKATANARVRFGVTVSTLVQNDEEVTVSLSDGTLNTYDWVVGADGIRSSVRRQAFGDDKTVFRGQMGWRFFAPLPESITGWAAFLGKGRAFLFVPMGQGRTYCYADEVVAQPDTDQEAHLERLQVLFKDFPPAVREAVAGIDTSQPVHYAPVEEVIQTKPARGRIILIGDAAHAMSPNMASGAAMAFEDALVLADLFLRNVPAQEISPQFNYRRAARVDWIRNQTHRRDRMRNLNPALRDFAMRLLWQKIYAANYQPLLMSP